MARQSLYRTYRPATFDDVVGQQHITRTLRNAVREGAVAHAYLFTGPRGTGKTTTARILAKALLCVNGPTPDPDPTCDQCVEIAEGRHPDVFELDAASRTGVENVREEIIGRVAYAPARGGYKVYIIDEVHMLSAGSFNALLKTLEEPPSHVVFVLCTTHPHKVPETIHSRCQRFDFHRIGIEDIVSKLRQIADAEGIEVADASLVLMARHAAGGMRDAITTLEQLAAFGGRSIALEDVEGLLGEVDTALLYELAELVARRDVAGAFRFVARLAESGTDMAEFARGLTAHYRDLYVTAVAGEPAGIVDATSEEMGRLAGQAREYGPDRLSRILDLLGALDAQLRWSSDQRLALEVALTRMARPGGELSLEALSERVEAIERGMPAATPVPTPRPAVAAPAPVAPASAVPAAEPTAPAERPVAPTPKAAPVESPAPAPAAGSRLDRAHVKREWPAVVAEVKKVAPPRASLFADTEVDVDADGETLVIEFAADAGFTRDMADEPETVKLLRKALATVLGAAPRFRYQIGRGRVRPAVEPSQADRRTDTPPSDMPDETDTGTFRPVAAREENRPRDAASLLIDELGAEVVMEHKHGEPGEEPS